MPERGGWSVLRDLKADPDLCEIPVIFATVPGDRETGLVFGAVDHLAKPINPQRFIDTLNAFAGNCDRTVLVVDDDPASRTLLRRILIREGWAVREASDGVRALAQLGMRRPTIMVLDLKMPNLDRFEILRAGRQQKTLEDLPVILATSKDFTREELNLLHSNARDVLIRGHLGRADIRAVIRRNFTIFAEQEGVDPAGSEYPDNILMDMSLPVPDGWEATRAIKSDPATSAIRVIR